MRNIVIVAVSLVAALAGCPSRSPKAHGGPSGEVQAPASSQPDETARATPPPAKRASCRAILIRREGLDEETCKTDIGRIEKLPSESFACKTDADCRILPVAGGCLGINASSVTDVESLPEACAGDCAGATFDDHRVRCDAGCCSIYEE